jgi:hypothetical protein
VVIFNTTDKAKRSRKMNYLLSFLMIMFLSEIKDSPKIQDGAMFQSWAKRPPMGWNSYDCFGAAVYESDVKANTDYMAENLKESGWEYIVVDYCWSYPHPPNNGQENPPQFKLPNGGLIPWLEMDNYGRLLPDPRKFPSCTGDRGFKPLADYVHGKGLKFGIHVMRGIPRQAVLDKYPIKGAPGIDASMIADTTSICPWLNQMWGLDMTKKGAQEYLDSILELYASWGVDYIKVDDMNSKETYHKAEVEGYRKAINKCGRPIVLSLSPRISFDKAAGHIEYYANLWRISADFWDRWRNLKESFNLIALWNGNRRPGCWPDADMIPFGKLRRRGPFGEESYSRFTKDEHYTLMTLWCIVRSPLMFGGDMPLNDEFTNALITNKEVLEANKSGSDPRQLFYQDNQAVWYSKAKDGGYYIGLFNLGEKVAEISVTLTELGIKKNISIRDLWQKKDLGEINSKITQTVNPHGAVMLKTY